MLELVLFLGNLHIEIESFGRFVAFPGVVLVGTHREIVGARFDELRVGGFVAEKLDHVVLMHRVDHVPCVLHIFSGAGALYGAQQMLEPVLPYLGAHVFAALLEHMDQKRHLAEVQRIVFEGELCVFDDGVDFLARVCRFGAEVVGFSGIGRHTVGVVIFLEHVAEVEIAELLRGHGGIVDLVFRLQTREIIWTLRVEGSIADCLEVGLFHFDLAFACGIVVAL